MGEPWVLDSGDFLLGWSKAWERRLESEWKAVSKQVHSHMCQKA